MEKELITKDLADKLDKYTIISPDDNLVKQTMLIASNYLHMGKSLGSIGILRLAAKEIRFYKKQYFLIVLGLFLIGLFANQLFEPGLYIIMLSPLPVLAGFTQIIRQDTELELEMTCRYSFIQLLAARLVIVESIGVLFALMLACLSGGNFIHQILLGITPLLILSSIFLIGIMRWRSSSTPIFVAIGWCMSCFSVQYAGMGIYKVISAVNNITLAVACIFALIAIFAEIKWIAAAGFPLKEGG